MHMQALKLQQVQKDVFLNTDVALEKYLRLEYGTAGWYGIQAVLALAFGINAGSIALSGFGLMGLLQASSVLFVIRRLRQEIRTQIREEESTPVERRMFFYVGVAFFLLLLYILNESGSRLYYREKPDPTTAGIVLAALSLIATIVLAILKFRIAKTIERRSLRREAIETTIGIYIPLAIGVGLYLNQDLKWWWADPVSSLFMLPFLFRQGWIAVEGSKTGANAGGNVRIGS